MLFCSEIALHAVCADYRYCVGLISRKSKNHQHIKKRFPHITEFAKISCKISRNYQLCG